MVSSNLNDSSHYFSIYCGIKKYQSFEEDNKNREENKLKSSKT